jgi:hypothetical protein
MEQIYANDTGNLLCQKDVSGQGFLDLVWRIVVVLNHLLSCDSDQKVYNKWDTRRMLRRIKSFILGSVSGVKLIKGKWHAQTTRNERLHLSIARIPLGLQI